jgi:hypothetical protein
VTGCGSIAFDDGPPSPSLPATRQKPLEASAEYFNKGVLVSVLLTPVQLESPEERSLAKSTRAEETATAASPSAPGAPQPAFGRGPRVNLFVSIVSESKSDVVLGGIGVESDLGRISHRLPGLILAPCEDALLDTITARFAGPIPAFDVRIDLREGAMRETRTLHLVPWTGKMRAAGRSRPDPALRLCSLSIGAPLRLTGWLRGQISRRVMAGLTSRRALVA